MQPEGQTSLTPGPKGPARERGVHDIPLLLLLCALLFALRAAMAHATVTPNFDTATPGLMALDILEGARPLFYYGQNYMGAIEAYAAAVFFALLGPSSFALSLAPILFGVGWAAAQWLLFRSLFGRAAAWAAFALAAMPGWTVLRVGLNSYGGYTVCYCLGTLAWWSGVLAWRAESPRARHVAAAGLCAGLALWSNFQCAVLVLMGGIFLAVALLRVPPRRWPWGGVAAGAFLFALAFSPVVLLRGAYQGGHVAALEFTGDRIATNLGILCGRLLPWMVAGRPELPAGLGALLGLVFASALLFSAVSWRRRGRPAGVTALAAAAPWLSCALFLVLYLPHPMASEGASRYLVSFWTVLVSAVFATPLCLDGGTRVARALLAGWCALNLAVWGVNLPVQREIARENRERQAEVVRTAAGFNADAVVLCHDLVSGHEGQAFAFAATNRVNFVSIGDERRQDRAEQAERAERPVFAFPSGIEVKARDTLSSLGFIFNRARTRELFFAFDVRAPAWRHHLLAPASIRAWTAAGPGAEAGGVLDRTHGTTVSGALGEGIWMDLGRTQTVSRLWLFSAHPFGDGLPEGLDIAVSADNRAWSTVFSSGNRYANAYSLQGRPYCNGFLGRFDAAIPASSARYVRLVITRVKGAGPGWSVDELLLFAPYAGGGLVGPAELDRIARETRGRGVPFVATDRWLSPRLADRGVAGVFPRFNTKVTRTQPSRELRPGCAVAVPEDITADTVRTIRRVWGDDAVTEAMDTGSYSLILTNPRPARPSGKLCWNDHLVLEFTGAEPAWR